jgi:hypothetical protein
MNGNKERETLVGGVLFAMVFYLKEYPCALAQEQVSTKTTELGMTKQEGL